jgi:F0F1-type ATP synthase membrane subunit c/vacuolar-type H+-ATPase subunit K
VQTLESSRFGQTPGIRKEEILSMEYEADLQREYRTTTIIAAAMASALLVYTAIVEVMKYQHSPFTGFSPESVASLRDIFLLSILVVLVAIRKIRISILKKEKTDNLESLVKKLKVSTIITFAFCEVPAILGLIIFFLGGFAKEYYILLTCSMVSMFIYFPRYRHWKAFVGRATSFY